MVLYRRNRIQGGTYAFTVTLKDRSADTLTRHVAALRSAVKTVRKRWPFHIHASVVLPDHLHMIWQLPENSADYSIRWQLIKTEFTRQTGIYPSPWQKRFWEHTIRDDDDFSRHVDYIHYNPVKHGYVRNPADWPHSSIRRWVRQGLLPADWGGAEPHDIALMEP